jgi:curved DNA-binding protein CbpA
MTESTTPEPFKNYYEVLRVRPYDAPELIQAAFAVQIKQWHPDRFANADALSRQAAEDRTKLIIAAKRTLLSPALKVEYDKEFERRFPRRWEKLTSKARPKQREVSVEELLKNGVPVNPLTQNISKDEAPAFRWLSFSTRVNFKTKQVIFSVAHFLDHNPNCEVRFKFHYNQDWTAFSPNKLVAFSYSDDVALVEMQARHIDSKGKIRYSPRVFKVVVLSPYETAMSRKREILRHQSRLKNRLGLKLIIAILGSSLMAPEFADLIFALA